jgi:hypothetical protein
MRKKKYNAELSFRRSIGNRLDINESIELFEQIWNAAQSLTSTKEAELMDDLLSAYEDSWTAKDEMDFDAEGHAQPPKPLPLINRRRTNSKPINPNTKHHEHRRNNKNV